MIHMEVLAAVFITKKNCLQIFVASMRVIFAITGNSPLIWTIELELQCHTDCSYKK